MEQHIFGVAEVNQMVKLLLDGEPMLQDVYVRGSCLIIKCILPGTITLP